MFAAARRAATRPAPTLTGTLSSRLARTRASVKGLSTPDGQEIRGGHRESVCTDMYLVTQHTLPGPAASASATPWPHLPPPTDPPHAASPASSNRPPACCLTCLFQPPLRTQPHLAPPTVPPHAASPASSRPPLACSLTCLLQPPPRMLCCGCHDDDVEVAVRWGS